jgi:hypothetical protein
MKKFTIIGTLLLFTAISIIAQQKDFLKLTGPYLGQKPPGMTPEIFAPGIVSKAEFFEHSSVYLTPDLNEIYWISDSVSANYRRLLFVRYEDGRWTQPKDAGICNHYANSNLSFSSDGNRLYFSSRMSLNGSGELKDTDIWFVDRIEGGWAKPSPLSPIINTDKTEALGIVLNNGAIYFSDYHDIYRSEMRDGEYQKPEKLSEVINTEEFDLAPYVT